MKRILIGAIGSVVVLVGIILSQPLEKSEAQMEGSSKSDVRAESAKRSPSVARQFLASLGLEYSAESFVLAASNGDHVAAQAYIDSGMDVNAASENGRTALMEAALKDNLEIARMLLEAGANPNAQDEKERTALLFATKKSGEAMFRLLFEHSANYDQPMLGGFTPLIVAADEGRTAIVDLLLNAGADANHLTELGVSSLFQAVVNEHVECARLLLQHGADVNLLDPTDSTVLHLATLNGDVEMVRLLLDSGADVQRLNNEQMMPMDYAYQHLDEGESEKAKQLMLLLTKAGASQITPKEFSFDREALGEDFQRALFSEIMSTGGKEPIKEAAKYLEMVTDRYEENGSLEEVVALYIAAYQSALELQSLLAGHVVSGQRPEEYPPYMTAQRFRAAVVDGLCNAALKALDKKTYEINAVNDRGMTLLMIAAVENNTYFAEEFLKRGASLDPTDERGRSALDYARLRSNSAMVELLREKARIN